MRIGERRDVAIRCVSVDTSLRELTNSRSGKNPDDDRHNCCNCPPVHASPSRADELASPSWVET